MEEENRTCGCCPAYPKLDRFTSQILQESNLHGVKYIGKSDLHITERIFWTVTVLTAVGFSGYLVSNAVIKYIESPVIISFQSMETSISQIPFPAITICNVNMLRRDIVNKFRDNLITNQVVNYTESDLKKAWEEYAIMQHLTHYCLATPSFRREIGEKMYDMEGRDDYFSLVYNAIIADKMNASESAEVEDKLSELINITSGFYLKASHNCDDMILKCMWSRKEIPCQEIFFDISTTNGRCCVFNMMPSYILRNIDENDVRAQEEKANLQEEAISQWKKFDVEHLVTDPEESIDKMYPRHQRAGGKPYGLQVLVNPELETYSTCTSNDGVGLKVTAHNPVSFPSITDYGKAIPPKSEVFIDIDPWLTVADDEVLQSVPIGKRGCYVSTDKEAKLKHYKYYSGSNCMDECIAEYTFQNCSCVRFFMPRNATRSLCGASKRICAEEVLANLTQTGKNSHCSKCLPLCTEIVYNMRMTSFPLRENVYSGFYNYSTRSSSNNEAANYSILHIFLGTDSLYAKQRKTLYDASSLIANAGGLLGLTIGFSIVSVVEFIYFFTLRAWFQSQGTKKENTKAKDGIVCLSTNETMRVPSDMDSDYQRKLRHRFSGSLKCQKAAVMPYRSEVPIYPYLS